MGEIIFCRLINLLFKTVLLLLLLLLHFADDF